MPENFLQKIRKPLPPRSVKTQVFITAGILLFGVLMGTFSKFLDYRQAELPEFFQAIDAALDLHNFLGWFSPWMVIALCLAVYSTGPFRAAVNVFTFFAGMVASYYLYSYFVAGFFPKSYAMIWFGLTALSPGLAFICWYAKGDGPIALGLSAGITGILLNFTILYGLFYVDLRSWPDLFMLLLGGVVLRRSRRETVLMLGIGAVFAVLLKWALLF